MEVKLASAITVAIILIVCNRGKGQSHNQPKLLPTASWDPNAVTFSYANVTGVLPWDLYIDKNNTIYVNGKSVHSIFVFPEGSSSPTRTLTTFWPMTWGVFVTDNGDIYGDTNNNISFRVDKWRVNGATNTVMYVNASCVSLFVDVLGSIYCTSNSRNQVSRRSLNETADSSRTVAGSDLGVPGSTPTMLRSPRTTLVTIDLHLYVADCGNNRVQFFRNGERNATTIVSSQIIDLSCPSGLALDAEGYLFITDYSNNRIIGSGPYGYRCIAGCSRINGTAADQLYCPRSLRFDTYGNIYVADGFNHRIQKFVLVNDSYDVPYNRPKLDPLAAWNSTANVVSNASLNAAVPWGLFVTKKNSLLIAARSLDYVQIWKEGSTEPWRNVYMNSGDQTSVFATTKEEVYHDRTSSGISHVMKFSLQTNVSTTVMIMPSRCHGLFLDLYENIYCSMGRVHHVVKRSLTDNSTVLSTVAGNGTAGSTSTMLANPQGIFITIDFHLYVADCNNDRIQLFLFGQRNGTTVAGQGANGTVDLDCPTSLVLDHGGYLFITDSVNHRIVGSGPLGFRCIFGCMNAGGPSSNQLNGPSSLSFDSYGHLYVADCDNSRIVKLILTDNRADESSTGVSSVSQTVSPTSSLNATHLGSLSNRSTGACDLLQPCFNDGTCTDADNITLRYVCQCLSGLNGTECQNDHRVCRTDTCRNGGTCYATSNSKFQCLCGLGWESARCEQKINYCRNVTCLNDGVCRSLVTNFRCECLSDVYSGQYCETIASRITIRKIVAKSLAYVAIIAMSVVVLLLVFMDLLKYFFGIDTIKRRAKRRRKPRNREHKFC